MTWTPWKIDIAVAVAIAAVVLIVVPGVAIAAILALLLLIVLGGSLVRDRRRARPAPRRTTGRRTGRR